MVLHRIDNVDLAEDAIDKIEQIKSLKWSIDTICNDLVSSLFNNGVDVDTVQDIVFESGITDIVGRITVNQCVKSIYKTKRNV